jgi:hypothetical protein
VSIAPLEQAIARIATFEGTAARGMTVPLDHMVARATPPRRARVATPGTRADLEPAPRAATPEPRLR